MRLLDLLKKAAEFVNPTPAAGPDVTVSTGGDVWVFTGGGSRGAVQVGMMKALYEHGSRPVATIGCSVGALNAAWYAKNPTLEGVISLEELWMSLKTNDVFPIRIRNVLASLLFRNYIIPNNGVHRLVDRLDLPEISDAQLPLRIVTSRFHDGKEVVHGSGDTRSALVASCAIPGVFPPVEVNGELHMDGAFATNAPVHLASEFAPGRIFLLDASGPSFSHHARTARALRKAGRDLRARSQLIQAKNLPGVIPVSVPDHVYSSIASHEFGDTAASIKAGYEATVEILRHLSTQNR